MFLHGCEKTWQDGRRSENASVKSNTIRAVYGVPPLHKLDQKMMRQLRNLADRTGWTVERCIREAIADFVAKHLAEKEREQNLLSFRETHL